MNREHQLKSIEIQSPFIFDGTLPIGWIEPDAFRSTTEIMQEQGILIEKNGTGEVYTRIFLEKVYDKDEI